ncbi:MAG: ketopantoate reductase family protein [Dongiaceae bacterium]
MRIAMIGAGAMGCVYGGLLQRAGEDVTLIDIRAEQVSAIAAHGLRLTGVSGEHRVRPRAAGAGDPLPAFELAVVFVDANATAAAAAQAARLLAPDGHAVTLQNGIGNVEALVAALGRGRVLAGVTMNSANAPGPAHGDHSHAGPTWVGELDGRRSARLDALVAMLARAGLETRIVDDPMAHIWNKFLLNCALNPLCALTGLRPGHVPDNPAMLRLLERIVAEVLAVVRAKGIRLPDPDPLATVKGHCVGRFNRPSMLQHVEQGRRTEIDALNGALVREAEALGLAAPYNDAIACAVKGLEAARMAAVAA